MHLGERFRDGLILWLYRISALEIVFGFLVFLTLHMQLRHLQIGARMIRLDGERVFQDHKGFRVLPELLLYIATPRPVALSTPTPEPFARDPVRLRCDGERATPPHLED
jgi:hypothetical protein